MMVVTVQDLIVCENVELSEDAKYREPVGCFP